MNTGSAYASHTLANSFGATGTVFVVAGWWYPTTLTATWGLWSGSLALGSEINTTTSELRMRTDNTTDGQWTTTGVGLTVNQWKFVAWLCTTTNTGTAAAWRVWAGDELTPPTEVTVTQAVAPAGNFTGASNFYAGNMASSGSLAFRGDIGWITYLRTTQTGTGGVFGIAAHGTITQAEANIVRDRMVLPMWQGQAVPVCFKPHHESHASGSLETLHIPFYAGAAQDVASRISSASPTTFVVSTQYSNIIASQRRAPVVPYGDARMLQRRR